MNKIFSTIHWKAFFITLVVTTFLSGCYAVLTYANDFLEYSAPASAVLYFGLLSMLSIITYTLCYSISIGAVIAFRKLADRSFLSAISSGLVIVIPLAVAIGCYSNMVQPRLTAKSAGVMWDVMMGASPEYVEDSFIEIGRDFENITPGTTTCSMLSLILDSLQLAATESRAECGKLLAQLPDTMALRVYESYRLEQQDVEYQCASGDAVLDIDIVDYAQLQLYWSAERLSSTLHEENRYRLESAKRMATAIYFVVCYLVFATAGYCIRNFKLRNIVVIVASAVVSLVFVNGVAKLVELFLANQILN